METPIDRYKVIITIESLTNFFEYYKNDLEFRICQVFYNTIMTYKEKSEILKDVCFAIDDIMYKDLHSKFEETMDEFNSKVLLNEVRHLVDDFSQFINAYDKSTECVSIEYDEDIFPKSYTFIIKSSIYSIDRFVEDLQSFVDKSIGRSMEKIDGEIPACFKEKFLHEDLIFDLLYDKFKNQLTDKSMKKISGIICESPEKFNLKLDSSGVDSDVKFHKL